MKKLWSIKRRRMARLALILAFLLPAVTGIRDVPAAEEPDYEVLKSEGDFELRRYAPYIVAQTIVEGDFEDAGGEGFTRLADYIGGGNRSGPEIEMTAPVAQEAAPQTTNPKASSKEAPGSERIEAGAFVGGEGQSGKWRVAFVMPSEYTMETLPEPADESISLKAKPGGLMAVVEYSGWWSRENYEENLEQLRNAIDRHGLRAVGDPVWARYDPPFMPWFLRRNEIWIPVERVGG
jgi:hypothetical protein